MSGKIDKMSDIAAAVVMQNLSETDPEKLKQQITQQLDRMLSNGEISEEDYKAGIKLTNKNSIMTAIVSRNKTEGSFYDSVVNGNGSLVFNSKADALMKDSGLNIDDLYEAAKIADSDYTVQEKELTKIQQFLNDKLKANGTYTEDTKLSKKDVQLLMEGLGLQVKRANVFARALTAVLGDDTKNKTEKSMDKLHQKAEAGIAEYVEQHKDDKVLTVMNEDLDKTIQKYKDQGAKVIIVEENVLYTVIRITPNKNKSE